MLGSLRSYGSSFLQGAFDTRSRALIWAHRKPFGGRSNYELEPALRAAVGYILRAQQHGSDMGIGSYHLTHGWGASYPETTGYLIPTLLAVGEKEHWQEPIQAAIGAADWLLNIQLQDGGWQGGRVGEARPAIVFNTAQVIRGLLATHAYTGEPKYLGSAARAGQWIIQAQDGDGAWRASNFLGAARVYDTYVGAPLLQLHAITGERVLKEAAVRNLEWVLAQQQPNGWFANCDNTLVHNDRPITHTLAYTIDGALQCGQLLGREDLIEAGMRPARVLLDHYLELGTLYGRYDAQWRGSEFPLMTGCAQLAIIWAALHARTGEAVYREGCTRMVNDLIGIQQLSFNGPGAQHGAMPGSYPLWGRYEKFAFPNWATKYFIDAVLMQPA